MPLFEYACRACGHQFEYLTRAEQTPSCPACASASLEKKLSVFAVSAPAASTHRGAAGVQPCGSCGDPAGSCAVNFPGGSLN